MFQSFLPKHLGAAERVIPNHASDEQLHGSSPSFNDRSWSTSRAVHTQYELHPRSDLMRSSRRHDDPGIAAESDKNVFEGYGSIVSGSSVLSIGVERSHE